MKQTRAERAYLLVGVLGVALTLFVASATHAGERITAKVLSVSADGVLRVQAAHGQFKVVAAGIALPPVGHPHRNAARKALGELVFDKTVELSPVGEHGADLVEARVLVAGQDIAPALLSAGHAYVPRGHPLTGDLLRFELSARNARRGLWAYGEPTLR